MKDDISFDLDKQDITEKFWKDRLMKDVKRHHVGPWDILIKIDNFPIYVAPEKKFIFRTVRPMAPFGPWMVYRFSYKNRFYKSLGDDIWNYCTIKAL